MGQFVGQHIAEGGQVSQVGDYHPALAVFEETAHPFRDHHGQDIGLLEMDMAAVDDQGHCVPEGVVEFDLQVPVGILQNLSGDAGNFSFLLVIVYVEMVCFQDPPVELFILDFIAPEIELGTGKTDQQEQDAEYAFAGHGRTCYQGR